MKNFLKPNKNGLCLLIVFPMQTQFISSNEMKEQNKLGKEMRIVEANIKR